MQVCSWVEQAEKLHQIEKAQGLISKHSRDNRAFSREVRLLIDRGEIRAARKMCAEQVSAPSPFHQLW